MKTKIVYYVISLLEGMGMGSMFPIYTPWLELHGLNFFKMGAVNFFYHISVSILDPFTGFVADKFGKRQTFIVGQILWTSTQFIYGASSQIPGFLLAEGVAAVGNSLKSDALESWLQNKLGENESSKVMGKSRSIFTVGQITTGILAGYISATHGLQTAWFVSGTFFLMATILGSAALFLAGGDIPEHDEKHEEVPDVNLRKIFKLVFTNKKILTIVTLVTVYSFANKPIFMYWPQLVAQLKMPDEFRGWTILAISLPAMFGSLLTGHNIFFRKDKLGLIRIFVVLGMGLATAAIANSLLVFFIGLILVEIAYGSLNIVTYGYLYQEVHAKHRSTVNSIVSATKTLGGAFSLLIMGEIADLVSIQATLAIGGTMILLLLIFYIRSKE